MSGADGAAMRAYGDAKFNELQAQFPNATQAQFVAALDKEMEAKFGGLGTRTREVPLVADGSPAGGSGGGAGNDHGGAITPATMTQEHKAAFRQLQDLGAYKISETGKGGKGVYASEADALKAYLQGVNQSASEDERIWGGR